MSEVGNIREFYISLNSAHAILAQACLTVMLQLDEKIDKKRLATFSLAFYAAQFWFVHAKYEGVAPQFQDAMERIFNPSNPYLAAWVWIHDVDESWAQPPTGVLSDRPSQPTPTALYYAASCGLCGPAKYLIFTHGEDVNAKTGYHGSPLHAASRNGHLDAVSLLLDHGADVNMTDSGRQTVTPLHEAYFGNHLEVMRKLLEHGAALDIQDSWGGLLTHSASLSGHVEALRLLLHHNADVNATDNIRFTPLHWASKKGHADAAQLLLENGADINALSFSETPLYEASEDGRLEVAQLLLARGADVHMREPGFETPLQVATRLGHTQIVQLLLEHGAEKE
jgi:ankyrin repeat protein